MDSKEIIAAMKARKPVLYQGRQYRHITEYILCFDERGEQKTSAVLLDMQSNSTLRVPSDRVEPAG